MSNQPGRSLSSLLFLHARVSLWCLSNRSLQSGCFMKIIRDGFLSCIGSWSFRSITCSFFSTDLSLASSGFSGPLKSDSFQGSLERNQLNRKCVPRHAFSILTFHSSLGCWAVTHGWASAGRSITFHFKWRDKLLVPLRHKKAALIAHSYLNSSLFTLRFSLKKCRRGTSRQHLNACLTGIVKMAG